MTKKFLSFFLLRFVAVKVAVKTLSPFRDRILHLHKLDTQIRTFGVIINKIVKIKDTKCTSLRGQNVIIRLSGKDDL